MAESLKATVRNGSRRSGYARRNYQCMSGTARPTRWNVQSDSEASRGATGMNRLPRCNRTISVRLPEPHRSGDERGCHHATPSATRRPSADFTWGEPEARSFASSPRGEFALSRMKGVGAAGHARACPGWTTKTRPAVRCFTVERIRPIRKLSQSQIGRTGDVSRRQSPGFS